MKNNTNDSNNSYLIVQIGTEKYAIHVKNVISIQEMLTITQIPLAPAFLKGLINLRGSAIPVIDSNIKLGLGQTQITGKTGIIVMSFPFGNQDYSIAALVDAVDEVMEITEEQIGPPPSMANTYKSEFISGKVTLDQTFIMILDFIKLFKRVELEDIEHALIEKV